MDETLHKKKKKASSPFGGDSESSSLEDSGIDLSSTDLPPTTTDLLLKTESDTEMRYLVKGGEEGRTIDEQPLLMMESDVDTDGNMHCIIS